MNAVELKKEFHELIESIDNEILLADFYELIKNKVSGKEGKLWGRLTPEEQKELITAFEESEDPVNLISHKAMKKKHKKWL